MQQLQTSEIVEYSAHDKATYELNEIMQMSKLYEKSAKANNDSRALAIAYALQEQAKPINYYIATDLVNRETGELFEGYDALVTLIASRTNKTYLRSQARRHRKFMRLVLDNYKTNPFHRYQFITFTLPFLRTDFETVLKINARAMELFKKRKVWTSNVEGAFMSEEFTIGAETTELQTHYHSHYHALVIGKTFLDKHLKINSLGIELSDAWTNCVEKACLEFDVEFLLSTKGNRLQIKIKDVQSYANKKCMSFETSVQELCKYIIKGSEFKKVPYIEVVQLDNALRGRKMYKTYGAFAKTEIKKQDWYLATESEISERSVVSLDTQCTTDGKQELPLRTPKTPTLTDVGERLINEGRANEYRSMLSIVAENRREFRAELQALRYPHARFQTLSGQKWCGVSERPPNNLLTFIPKQKQKTVNAGLLDLAIQKHDNVGLLNEIIENTQTNACLLESIIESTISH
jgi:hypothetical protein